MGFVIVGRCEIRLVGRDQRQALGVGEIDQPGFDAAFLVDAVALQFDIEAVAEQAGQPVAAGCRERGLIATSASEIGPSGPPVSAIRSSASPSSQSNSICGA